MKATGVYTLSNLMSGAVPFALLPILTRYLTPEDYGILAMFQVLLGCLVVLTGVNVHGAVGRQYFEKDRINFPNYIGNCVYIVFTSSAVVSFLLCVFSDSVSSLIHFPKRWLWSAAVVALGQCLTLIALSLWQSRMKATLYGIFQFTIISMNIGLSLFLVVSINMRWQGRIGAQVISYLSCGVIALYLMGKGGWLQWGLNAAHLKSALRFGVPLVPHAFAGIIMGFTDRVLITNMMGLGDTGVYVVGAQIGMVIGLIQVSFNSAWVPWFYSELKKEKYDVKLRIVKITYLYHLCIFSVAVVFGLMCPWVMQFFVGKKFTGSSQYVLWIALGYAFDGMYKMVSNYLFFAEKTHFLAVITLSTAVIHFGLCYSLIRVNGAVGAAQATALAFLIAFVFTWVMAARVYRMPWGMKVRHSNVTEAV